METEDRLRDELAAEAGALKARLAGLEAELASARESEAAARRARDFADAIINTTRALIIVLDPDGAIARVNRACEVLTGYRADELVGQRVWEILIPPDEVERVRQTFGGLLVDEGGSSADNHWVMRNGELRLIAWANTTLRNADGSVRWIVGTGMDVTERRRLEEQLNRAARLEAVGQLAGGVAHDFNNLLTAILGYIDLDLPSIPAGSQLCEDMGQMRKAARRASDLTRQLLAFSKQQGSQPQVLDLNAAVADVGRMLRHLVEENVEIQVVLAEEAVMVRADPAQIGQVLMNLTVNARDAMPNGGLLKIETAIADLTAPGSAAHPGKARGYYARLTLADTGVGMDERTRERVYDPFFTTKDVGGGTGLGMSTVYGIVDQHGGWVDCHSRPGVGTAFNVYLPLVEEGQPAMAARSELGVSLAGREVVLIAEDQPEVRDLAARVLGDFGYQVLVAADGPEALALVQDHADEIDLLIADMVMPAMGGLELAGRARLVCPSLHLLFITGYASGPVAAGSDGQDHLVLAKPFQASELAAKVRQILDSN